MGPSYLVLAPATCESEAAFAEAIVRLRAEGGWDMSARCGRAVVLAPDTGPAPVLVEAPGCVVIGRALCAEGRSGATAVRALPPGLSAARRVDRLLRDVWGAYVALLDEPAGEMCLLRDPSGAVECLTWRTREGIDVATADLQFAPPWLQPPRLSLNWDRIAAFLNATSAQASESLFDGLTCLPPGAVGALGGGSKPTLAWRPARWVRDPIVDIPAAEAELVRRVDLATSGLVASHARVVFELSGGLDSSILAMSLAHTGDLSRVAAWYNGVGARRDGDETRYARTICERLGVDLTFVPKLIRPPRIADFEEVARSFRPTAGGLDPGRDRDMVDLIRAVGATAVMSGQGGDAAFYQMPSSWLVTDVLRRKGLAAIFSSDVAAMALRKRRSAWTILAEAGAALRQKVQPARTNRLLTPAAAAQAEASRHPWEIDSLDLPLSKQLQVRGVAQAHSTRGDCRRERAAPLICPLIAQPVVELCLSIPAVDLGLGVQDRPLARRAFAHRLPDAVRDRRSKGNLTAHFAQLATAAAEELRPYLVDGVLADAGVLDRQAVLREFDPVRLVQTPRPSELLMAAATEAWVRYWQTQVPDALTARRRRP